MLACINDCTVVGGCPLPLEVWTRASQMLVYPAFRIHASSQTGNNLMEKRPGWCCRPRGRFKMHGRKWPEGNNSKRRRNTRRKRHRRKKTRGRTKTRGRRRCIQHPQSPVATSNRQLPPTLTPSLVPKL